MAGKCELWLLPSLLPLLKVPIRSAFGYAGLRFGSGYRSTKHALMAETLARKPRPEAIPLNM